jgi:hypothetical protein
LEESRTEHFDRPADLVGGSAFFLSRPFDGGVGGVGDPPIPDSIHPVGGGPRRVSLLRFATMKSERLLAELNRLRSDLDKDPSDLEWFTLHHVFCFVSYQHSAFQAYLDEAIKPDDEVPEA